MAALDNLSRSSVDHCTGKTSAACLACHQVLATTATPAPAPVLDGSTLEKSTTRITPGIFRTASLSTLATVPPITGDMRTAAYTMPAGRTSRPNCAVPFTLDGVSRRGCAWPISLKSLGDFRRISPGDEVAAATASAP